MTSIAEALADPSVRHAYLLFCFAIMVLPMVLLTIWHNLNIRKSPGGRELMRRQGASPARLRGTPGQTIGGLTEAASMARDISSGRYGDHARRTQNVVYWVAGLWVLANVVAFGILFWADEINRPPMSPIANP